MLRFEKLEDRVLLTAWPTDIPFHYKDIFNDGGGGLSSRRLAAEVTEGFSVENLLTSSGSKTRSVINGNSVDHNGALLFPDGEPRFKFAFLNGGSAASHSSVLGSTGRGRFAAFYDNGGSVAGSCAGLYLVDNFKIADVAFSHNSRSGSHDVVFGDHEFTDLLLEEAGTDVIRRIPHYYGPIIRPHYSSNTPGVEYVGTIKNASSSIYRSGDTPYLAIYKESGETGRFVGQTSHPEYYSSGQKADLMRSVMLYAMAGGETEPALKAELDINQVFEERVGDKQYHRYTVNVEPDIEKLSIEVEGNATLFVQHEDYAYQGSNLATSNIFSVEDPESGLWHISVYGSHTIRNGVPYELTVTDQDIFIPPPSEDIIENFTNGLPSTNWSYYSTGKGVIDASTGRMEMYSSQKGVWSLNEAILSVKAGVQLSFDQYWMKDEYHRMPDHFTGHGNYDGVSISSDGVNWYKIPHKNGHRVIDLEFTSDFQIKFQQYDNWTRDYDGRAWDNIIIATGRV